MKKLEIKAPAKINLGLKVVEKRTDGYHNIETVFYPINLFDIITFTHSESTSFICKNNKGLMIKDNSILQAVELLEESCKRKICVNIELEKNIPLGAGMGGGSSDGATALVALNEFFNLKLDDAKLHQLALEIGSDSPFFVNPRPSFAALRGEKLTRINLEIPFPILIVNPRIHISTKWAYDKIKPGPSKVEIQKVFEEGNINFSSLKNIVVNDFEDVVFEKYKEIRNIKESLYESGASFSLMTGSGSTVFGIFENINLAEEAEQRFPNNYFKFIHQFHA